MTVEIPRYTYHVTWSKEHERWEASVKEQPYLMCFSYDEHDPGSAVGRLCAVLDTMHVQELVLDAARNYCRSMFNYSPKNHAKGQEGANKHIENDAEDYLNPRELTLWLKDLVEAAVTLRRPLNLSNPDVPEAVKEELNPLQRPPTVTLNTGYKD